MAAQTSHHRVSSGMSLFHLNNCRQMLVLTHNRVWGTSKRLGLSVTLECFPQTAVTTWPMVWTPGLLAMALPMGTYFVALPSLQGHKDASRSIFHYLKHFVFSTFLIVCSYLFSFFFFSSLQIKSPKLCGFGAHMRNMQQNLELCLSIFQGATP